MFEFEQRLFASGHAERVQASGARVANISRLESAMPTEKVKFSSLAILCLLEE
ncbi:MAG TPA: hypothetical protein VEZ20_12035 [Allosphingosinicella sp.]|nr:hypothetical protein [Allosphingosinicella sp.]